MIWVQGKAYDYKGGMAVKCPRPPVDNLSENVMVGFTDGRSISPEQRMHAWALIGEISAYVSGVKSNDEKYQQYIDLSRDFLLTHLDTLTAECIERFSLGDTDQHTASLFISYLIEFILEHDIPTAEPLIELATDIPAYVYACCMNRKCAVCGAKADIHHAEGSKVGMGGNREEMCHIGLEVLPLCREHHNEAHDHGDRALMEKYHLVPVRVDEKMQKRLKLGRKKDE